MSKSENEFRFGGFTGLSCSWLGEALCQLGVRRMGRCAEFGLPPGCKETADRQHRIQSREEARLPEHTVYESFKVHISTPDPSCYEDITHKPMAASGITD